MSYLIWVGCVYWAVSLIYTTILDVYLYKYHKQRQQLILQYEVFGDVEVPPEEHIVWGVTLKWEGWGWALLSLPLSTVILPCCLWESMGMTGGTYQRAINELLKDNPDRTVRPRYRQQAAKLRMEAGIDLEEGWLLVNGKKYKIVEQENL